MQKEIIFVGGIHGVGKTYFCEKLAKELNLPHFSSSQLIANQREKIFTEFKNVEHIVENQDFLLSAIFCDSFFDSIFLLDGHFCLINKGGDIERLPEQTFKSLRPICLLVLVSDVERISLRLKNRDGLNYNLSFLEEFQEKEMAYASHLSTKLSVPLLIHSEHNSNSEVTNFIKVNIKNKEDII